MTDLATKRFLELCQDEDVTDHVIAIRMSQFKSLLESVGMPANRSKQIEKLTHGYGILWRALLPRRLSATHITVKSQKEYIYLIDTYASKTVVDDFYRSAIESLGENQWARLFGKIQPELLILSEGYGTCTETIDIRAETDMYVVTDRFDTEMVKNVIVDTRIPKGLEYTTIFAGLAFPNVTE